MVFRLAADGNAEHFEHRLVEAPRGREVRDDKLDMIDQAAAMKGLRFHIWLP